LRQCARYTDAPTAATTFAIIKGHNSGKDGRRKNPYFTIIYTSCLIICASLKEIRKIILVAVDVTRFGRRTY
jgi:hypothetical protein